MSPLVLLANAPLRWSVVGAPLANHLWQSTLFAVVAALLAFFLRKNHASTRYWLWLLASTKFLVPFSLLVAIGSHGGWSRVSANAQPELFLMMQGIGQPFGPSSPTHGATTMLALLIRTLPTLLAIVWIASSAAVLFYWYARWRRVTSALRGNLPVTSGREFEVLRGLEKNTAIAGEVKLVVSNAALEPGIVGVFHPILLLPSGIADRLTDAELQAIIIHELCHVRRRDNLSAALHMLVEAIFWLHPLVWWIGSHLVDERERACDEQVLLLGGDPQTYAESILKVCEFYLESPLPCTAGVTGSNLKRRIEAIMLHRAPLNLDLRKKLLLTAMAAMVLAGPIVIGILNPAPSRAQSKPAPTANSAPKYVLGDLRIDGDVHDRDGVRERVLKAWKDREYDDAEELASEVVGVGVRMDIQDRGYFKMVASEPVSQPLGVSDGKQRLLVTTSIVEGKQYHLGQLFIQSSEPDHALKVPAQTLKEQFQLRSGDLFKVSEIRSGMEKAMALYHTQGFADANIQPATSIDESHQLINLTLRVTEGPHS